MIHVAIVDDEKTTIESIVNLGNWIDNNMEITHIFYDGIELINHLELNPNIDLVITDIEMPGKTGIDVLDYIKINNLNVHTIVISAYDNFSYVQHSIKANAIDYILKPINVNELNLALRNASKDIKHYREKNLNPIEIYPYLLDKIKKNRVQLLSGLENNNLSFVSELLEKILNEENLNNLEIKNKIIFEINSVIEETVYKYHIDVKNVYPKQKITIDLSIDELLNVYTKIFTNLINIKSEKSGSLNIQDIKKYIDRNYKEPNISLSNISEQFHISNGYLSRLFKTHYNQNVTEYIINKKMNEAKDMIVNQNIDIKHAAFEVGYEDISYFYRVWKKTFNTTPKKSKLSNNESEKS